MYNYLSQSSYLASIFFSSQQAWIICISILRGFCIFRLLHFIALFQLHLKLVPEWQWWMYLGVVVKIVCANVAICHIPCRMKDLYAGANLFARAS
jgi:hypothetical protein